MPSHVFLQRWWVGTRAGLKATRGESPLLSRTSRRARSLRCRCSKGKGKGISGAQEARGVRPNFLPLSFRMPATKACERVAIFHQCVSLDGKSKQEGHLSGSGYSRTKRQWLKESKTDCRSRYQKRNGKLLIMLVLPLLLATVTTCFH